MWQVASVDGRTIPALGMAWSTCLNTRLMLTRKVIAESSGERVDRALHVIFSPYAANGCLSVAVNDQGMHGLVDANGAADEE